jgi:hypothetical protein
MQARNTTKPKEMKKALFSLTKANISDFSMAAPTHRTILLEHLFQNQHDLDDGQNWSPLP